MKTAATTATATAAATRGAIVWDAHAAVYEQVWERSTSLWGRDALVLGQLPSPTATTSPRFLDVACGTGAFAISAATLGFDVTATDFSAGMVARLEAKIAAESLKISTRVVDGQTLEGLEDESFDVVSSIFGAVLFPDRAAAWRSAWRVLTPGGRLLVTSWDLDSVNFRLIRYLLEKAENKPGAVVDDRLAHALQTNTNRTLAAASFQEELEEFGYQDVRIHTVSHPMCFRSGQEYVRAIVDNAGFMTMASHKDVASLERCILDFSQAVLDGRDPWGADVSARSDAGARVENHPLWLTPFALQAVGHIAVATKPM